MNQRDLGNHRATQIEKRHTELTTLDRYFCIVYWERKKKKNTRKKMKNIGQSEFKKYIILLD